MKRAGNPSIGRKLTAIIMLTTTCVLLLASIGYLIVDLTAMRSQQASDLTILANVIGDNASAFLLFGDHQSANEVLQALRAKPSIIAACIYNEHGQPLARYAPKASIAIPGVLLPDGLHRRGGRLELFYAIQ